MNNLIGIRKLIFGMFCQLSITVAVFFDKVTGDVFRDLTIMVVGAVIAGNVISKYNKQNGGNNA